MSAIGYELKTFDHASIAATRKAWLKTIDASPADFDKSLFEDKLTRLEGKCDYSAEEACYGIFPDGSRVASAYVDVTCTRAGRNWVKMMNMQLSPSLDLAVDKNSPDFLTLGSIFTSSIVGTLKLTSVNRSRVVKLYARSSVLLSFFKYISGLMEKDFKSIGGAVGKVKVSIEGRWLVFSF